MFFSIAPRATFTTKHVHFTNSAMVSLTRDFKRAVTDKIYPSFDQHSKRVKRELPPVSKDIEAVHAWKFFFDELLYQQKYALKTDDKFDHGAFSGHISTDGVTFSIGLKRKTDTTNLVDRLYDHSHAGLQHALTKLEELDFVAKFSDLLASHNKTWPKPSDLLNPEGTAWGLVRELGVCITAVDPGVTDWLTAFSLSSFARRLGFSSLDSALDGGAPASGGIGKWLKSRLFREPTKAYKTSTGMERARRSAQRRLRAAALTADVARVRSVQGTGRTANLSNFMMHAEGKLAAFEAGWRLFGSLAARREKLRVHRARERHFHRLTQKLAWGFSSVESTWQKRGLLHNFFCPADRPTLSIIGFGAAGIGKGSPVSGPSGYGPSRAFERFILSNYKTVCFVRVDEFRTSQVCTSCWKCDKKHLVVDGCELHKFQVCEHHEPKLVVDRDASASVAIMAVLLGMLFEQQVGQWKNGWRDRTRPMEKDKRKKKPK